MQGWAELADKGAASDRSKLTPRQKKGGKKRNKDEKINHRSSSFHTNTRVAQLIHERLRGHCSSGPARVFKATDESQMAAEASSQQKTTITATTTTKPHVPRICVRVSLIKTPNIRGTATQQGGFQKLPKCSIGGHSFDLRNALLKRQISCGQTRRCPFCPLS